jgi:Xaa-Pro aminopeptidase
MVARNVDALALSVGADLPWLCGYEAMPLERLTMLVVPRDDVATLVVPRLEAPRVRERPEAFAIRAWDEVEDPIEIIARLLGGTATVAVGDQTWARFLVDLYDALPAVRYRRASEILGPLRAVKDAGEIDALARAAAAADRVAALLQSGVIELEGRTEAEVSADVGARLLAEGHQRVNFAIVASGPNAASPHHDPDHTVIQPDQVVLCDFGGAMLDEHGVGYCSDITRCVWLGSPPEEFLELYGVLQDAQHAAVAAAVAGERCEDVDAVARRRIAAGGFGDLFIHRTGHGIGVEAHEDPYLVAGNAQPLAVGQVFSVEPGIYVPGRWGARLEDIVVVTDQGPRSLNLADHRLVAR